MSFEEVMDNLLVLNYTNRLKHKNTPLSEESKLREFGLIQVNPGRGVGKSTYIAQTATARDLVIIPNSPSRFLYKDCKAEIVYSLDIKSKSDMYDKIWVDEPMLTKCNAEMLTHLFAGKVNTIIMLGL